MTIESVFGFSKEMKAHIEGLHCNTARFGFQGKPSLRLPVPLICLSYEFTNSAENVLYLLHDFIRFELAAMCHAAIRFLL